MEEEGDAVLAKVNKISTIFSSLTDTVTRSPGYGLLCVPMRNYVKPVYILQFLYHDRHLFGVLGL